MELPNADVSGGPGAARHQPGQAPAADRLRRAGGNEDQQRAQLALPHQRGSPRRLYGAPLLARPGRIMTAAAADAQLLTINEAAGRLRCSRAHVYRLIAARV